MTRTVATTRSNPCAGRGSSSAARAARRLRAELDRPRFRRALERATRLADGARSSADVAAPHGDGDRSNASPIVHRRRSGSRSASVLAYDLDPRTAHPDDIHQMRIAAKGFRYTLEAFEDAVERRLKTLIEEVTASRTRPARCMTRSSPRERARTLIARQRLHPAERDAIEASRAEQDRRAAALRPDIHRRLETVRAPAFRRSLGECRRRAGWRGSPPAGALTRRRRR